MDSRTGEMMIVQALQINYLPVLLVTEKTNNLLDSSSRKMGETKIFLKITEFVD